MRPSTLLFSGLFTATVLLANPYESDKETLTSVIETGQKSSMQLLKTLGENLQQHMKAGGPMDAAKFCTTNAFALTDEVSDGLGKGVTVKRISLKQRNPANKPASRSEAAVLDSLQTLQENGVVLPEYLVERVSQDTYKYYKPLSINKDVCLSCHGDLGKDKALEDYIDKHYPEDKATGYMMGDLRGAIVVTIKR